MAVLVRYRPWPVHVLQGALVAVLGLFAWRIRNDHELGAGVAFVLAPSVTNWVRAWRQRRRRAAR